MINAAARSDPAVVFIEIGAVALGLAVLARLASRLGITAIPLYLMAGLLVGEGGIAPLDVSADFIRIVAEIGVLLLLLSLGLEYTAEELRQGLRTGFVPGAVDAATNFLPGFAAGLVLGLGVTGAVLLGGVCWVSSSGIVAKLLRDFELMGKRETPAILNLLVIEDLAMAMYLPLAAALVARDAFAETVTTVAVALAAVVLILTMALRFGEPLSALLTTRSDEALLLAVFGLTLLVAGLAQQLEVSAAIGAFLVGLALSGPVRHRAGALVGPLRDVSAAMFFLFFSFQIRPADVLHELLPAVALGAVVISTKVATGWVAAARQGAERSGRLRAGAALVARGEFSIVIASLGTGLPRGGVLGALAADIVLLTAIAGPLAVRLVARIGDPSRPRSSESLVDSLLPANEAWDAASPALHFGQPLNQPGREEGRDRPPGLENPS